MPKEPKSPLLIIGAGIAGLSVANALAEEYAVTVLEAQDRIGGRIFTIGDHLEAGPEFIHGNLPYTMDLVKRAGVTLEKCSGKWFRVSNCEWKEQDEEVEGWDELIKKIDTIEEDITLDAFLETHFADPRYEVLRHHARGFAAGFDLADPVKASIKALGKEWEEQSDEMYRIKEGYSSLINYLEKECIGKGCIIHRNKKIKQLDWLENAVTAYTDLNEKFTGDRIVITVPAGVLQRKMDDCSINFTPPIDGHEKAWEKIGFGSVLKLLLRFKQSFWEQQQSDIAFILSDEAIPTWWTQQPSKLPILTGWVGGPAALQWNLVDDEKLIEQAVQSLARIFKLTAAEIIGQLEEHHILRWSEVTASRGAYSYETPLSAQAIQLLQQPIVNTVFFAGESLYQGISPGTVEAALVSAAELVKKIRD
jgi:monoamine oxidase